MLSTHFTVSVSFCLSYTPFISPKPQSLRTLLRFQLMPLHSGALRFAFRPSLGSPHFGECGLKKGARYYRVLSVQVHKCISLRIIRCTLLHWQPHRRKLRLLARIRFQNTSRGSSRPPTSNAAFLTPVLNNAALERSHQTALFSKRLWLYIIGLIWKGY